MNHARFFENRLVRGLSRKQAGLLLAAGTVSRADAGTIIVSEGDVVDRLFILLAGEVQVFLPQTVQRVAAVNLNRLGEDDCFGEYAFIDQRPASASVCATMDSEIYEIRHDRLHEMLLTHADIGCIVYRNLLRVLVERLRASNAELDLFTLPDYEASA